MRADAPRIPDAAEWRAGSAEDEGRDLNGEDHRAKRASERTRAAKNLVKRPNEKCSVAYALDGGRVRCRQFQPPQRQRDQPYAQRRIRQLPQGQTPLRGAEPPGRGAQTIGDGLDRCGGCHVRKVPGLYAGNPRVPVTRDSDAAGKARRPSRGSAHRGPDRARCCRSPGGMDRPRQSGVERHMIIDTGERT